eukprot:PhF_6_TR19816/c0_g1_i1/m.28893
MTDNNEITSILDRIIAANDRADIIGVDLTTTTVEEVRKKYKHLAARIHPDKCTDPRATDAFAKLDSAAKLLSDEKALKTLQDAAIRKKRGREDNTGAPHATKHEMHMTQEERIKLAKQREQAEMLAREQRLMKTEAEKKAREAAQANEAKFYTSQANASNYRSVKSKVGKL